MTKRQFKEFYAASSVQLISPELNQWLATKPDKDIIHWTAVPSATSGVRVIIEYTESSDIPKMPKLPDSVKKAKKKRR